MEARLDGFIGLLKALKLWQMGLLVIVLAGSAGTTYGVYASTSNADRAELGENQQLIPASYGNLMNQVSTNGSLAFPEREALIFDSGGTVTEVLVKEGQRVTRGQVLASLDVSTVVSLEEAVADARIVLRDAAKTLSDLELEHALQVAEAEEAVASAELALQEANEALEDAQVPYTAQEIKTQEQVVAAAKKSLKTAEEALIDLEPDFSLQLAEALQSNREAEAALVDARKSLAEFENDHALELASAMQAKADAEVALDQGKTALEDYELSQGATLASLRAQKVSSQNSVAELQSRIDNLVKAQRTGSGNFSSTINSVRKLMEFSQEALDDVQGQVAEVERLESAVELAGQQLKDVRSELAELETGPDSLQRQSLEAGVQVAQSQVKVTAKALANLVVGLDPLEVALKQSDLALAEAALAQAEEDLAEILVGADELEVVLREKQVSLAQANLNRARANRAIALAGPDALDLGVRQAKVASARRLLNDAVQRLEDSTLRSPIDGLVSLVNVEEGDEVGASDTVVEVVNTTVVEIDGIVDEIDVLLVKEGIPVQVTLDALPGQRFEGIISEIAPAAQGQQGVVTFPISIQVEVPAGMQLREGLTAVANIVLSEEKDVLLVPQQALYGSFDQPVVRVMTATGIEERRVSLGNTDDFWVAVRDGLQEGDRVVMEGAAVNTTGSSFRQLRTITGGGRRR